MLASDRLTWHPPPAAARPADLWHRHHQGARAEGWAGEPVSDLHTVLSCHVPAPWSRQATLLWAPAHDGLPAPLRTIPGLQHPVCRRPGSHLRLRREPQVSSARPLPDSAALRLSAATQARARVQLATPGLCLPLTRLARPPPVPGTCLRTLSTCLWRTPLTWETCCRSRARR